MPYELLLTEPRSIRLGPYDDPPVAPEQVRAEAIVSGISHGTELALFRGVSPFEGKRFDADLRLFVDDDRTATDPMRLGYDWVETVRETGVAVRTPQTGDLVHLALPHRETQTITVEDDPRSPLTALPNGLDPERAALLQSTTIALQAIHDARLKLGDRIAVFGLGAFGLLAVQLARLSGAAWIAAADPITGRRALAEELGADLVLDPTAGDVGLELRQLDGIGVDVAVEFSGTYAALEQAMRSVRVGGTVVAAGFYAGGELALGAEFHHNRLTLLASMGGWGSS